MASNDPKFWQHLAEESEKQYAAEAKHAIGLEQAIKTAARMALDLGDEVGNGSGSPITDRCYAIADVLNRALKR